jgi:hypothetical protein
LRHPHATYPLVNIRRMVIGTAIHYLPADEQPKLVMENILHSQLSTKHTASNALTPPPPPGISELTPMR